jgi:hypothetical protein
VSLFAVSSKIRLEDTVEKIYTCCIVSAAQPIHKEDADRCDELRGDAYNHSSGFKALLFHPRNTHLHIRLSRNQFERPHIRDGEPCYLVYL